ncbi:MAG: sulfurtransferase TusA family protein [Deltaproteobacteria bacterium]|nr:sulfurtransferase TusA family protein [Deltaproteobacteria bacterium]
MPTDLEPVATVDITDCVCPMTFVKIKVAMDELAGGAILAVRLNDGEPVQNLPRSLKDEGHKVLRLLDNQDGTYGLLVKKSEEA